MKTEIIEGFDCVEMKRQAALQIHENLKGMNQEQRLDYWRKVTEEARKRFPNMTVVDSATSVR